MKILCSGNPNDHTVASGIKEIYPDADFASRATGYDLRFWNEGSETFFRNQINKYNVFINSSFLCKWCQHQLLEVTFEEWSKHNINGHIVNIGSSAQWEGVNNAMYGDYGIQKRALQERSLQLNKKNGIKTTHIVLSGINDGKQGHETWLQPLEIAQIIKLVIEKTGSTIPLIALI